MKTLTPLIFLFAGMAIGAVAGHYHGVAVTLSDLMAGQASMMRELEE